MSSIAPEPVRVAFTLSELERVLDFCERYPANDHPRSLLRRLITKNTTSPEGVLELRAEDGGSVVAVVVDDVTSANGCAVLDLGGVKSNRSLPVLLESLLVHAEDFVRAGRRDGLEVPVEPAWTGWVPILEARGYTLGFSSYDMQTSKAPPAQPLELPGPQWHWEPATSEWVQKYFTTMQAAMAPVPGAYLSSIDVFRDTLESKADRDELLIYGSDVAGFVCVKMGPDQTGLINMIGRHPDFRGHGLGPILMDRAMRNLRKAGAERLVLDVTATNKTALDLYIGLGFEITQTVRIYRQFF